MSIELSVSNAVSLSATAHSVGDSHWITLGVAQDGDMIFSKVNLTVFFKYALEAEAYADAINRASDNIRQQQRAEAA